MLHGKVHKIGGAVTDVRQQRHDDEEKQGSEREGRAEVGPSEHEPGDNDDEKDEIVEDAAGFPKAEGIGEEGAGRGEWRLRNSG